MFSFLLVFLTTGVHEYRNWQKLTNLINYNLSPNWCNNYTYSLAFKKNLLLLNIHSFHSNNVYTVNSVLGLTMHWLFCNRYRNLALLIEKTSWTDVRLPNSMYLYSLILKEYAVTAEKFKETILWLFIYGVKMLVRVDHVIKFYKAQRALWPKN